MEQSLTGFDTIFPDSPVVLDGGLGTILEDRLGSSATQSPLWSAHPVSTNPEALVQAHLSYLEAGASVISTSTYQCSVETFTRAGFDEQESKSLMLKAVRLADEARTQYGDDRAPATVDRTKFVALSLGPFGATLQPTQEFQGFYPPPYGPRTFTPDGPNENRFDNLDEELVAINALAEFHFRRLSVFAADCTTWASLDCIAFETVPLRREVIAIRIAMGRIQRVVNKDREHGAVKPWWISCVFPNGESPENANSNGKEKIQIDDMLIAAYRNGYNLDFPLAVPSGFGINCTSLDYIRPLCVKVRDYVKSLDVYRETPLWLVVYPNGGDYDEEKQAWLGRECRAEAWAQELTNVVETEGLKEHLLTGGCCRTDTNHIAALSCYVASDIRTRGLVKLTETLLAVE